MDNARARRKARGGGRGVIPNTGLAGQDQDPPPINDQKNFEILWKGVSEVKSPRVDIVLLHLLCDLTYLTGWPFGFLTDRRGVLLIFI